MAGSESVGQSSTGGAIDRARESSTEDKVRNVLAGRTAFGTPDKTPIAFPRDPATFELLVTSTDEFLFMAQEADDARLSCFIRKLACFLIRNGAKNPARDGIREGAVIFATWPDKTITTLSYAAAIRMSRVLRQEGPSKSQRQQDMQAALKVPEPPCPVVFTRGEHTLYELVHPMHLLRAGKSAGNCLARWHNGDLAPHPNYWHGIANGSMHIYALALGTTLCCVFAVCENKLSEWEFVHPEHTPADVFECCMKAVAIRLATPIEDCLLHIVIRGERIACPAREYPIIYHPAPRGLHERL